MKPVRTTFVVTTLFLLGCTASLGARAQASEPTAASVVARLSGVWNEGLRTDLKCGQPAPYLHRFQLSADGLVLTKRFLAPFQGAAGMVSEERYRVIYAGNDSLMLFKEGETFEHRDSGDKLLRQLIVEGGAAYAWRVYGSARDMRAAAGGLRCGD